jgi:hypothetical protein
MQLQGHRFPLDRSGVFAAQIQVPLIVQARDCQNKLSILCRHRGITSPEQARFGDESSRGCGTPFRLSRLRQELQLGQPCGSTRRARAWAPGAGPGTCPKTSGAKPFC